MSFAVWLILILTIATNVQAKDVGIDNQTIFSVEQVPESGKRTSKKGGCIDNTPQNAFFDDITGYFSFRILNSDADNESTAQDSIFANSQGNQFRLIGYQQIKLLLYGSEVLVAQLRPQINFSTASGQAGGQLMVDELYYEKKVGSTTFFTIGKRQIVNGVALGYNPTDFLNESKTEDRTLADEERRREREGDLLIDYTQFLNSFNFQATISPAPESESKTRILLEMSGTIDAINSDISILAFQADRPGVGLNIASTLSNNITVYLEYALRKGRDRLTPVLSKQEIGAVSFKDNSNQFFQNYVFGFQYTYFGGTNFNIEYWKNNNGLSNDEFDFVQQAILQPEPTKTQGINLLGTQNLRREKIFFRISDIEISSKLSAELTSIVSLDDYSLFLRSVFFYQLSPADSFRIGIDWFTGTNDSEFGLNPVNNRFFLSYTKLF